MGSHGDGFPTADWDPHWMDDPKVKRLGRLLREPGLRAQALVTYQATVNATWADGHPVKADDAMPTWIMDDADRILEALVTVGLLTASHVITPQAFHNWVEPAHVRRMAKVAAGALGGKRSWDNRRRDGSQHETPSTAEASLKHRSSDDPGVPNPVPVPVPEPVPGSRHGNGVEPRGHDAPTPPPIHRPGGQRPPILVDDRPPDPARYAREVVALMAWSDTVNSGRPMPSAHPDRSKVLDLAAAAKSPDDAITAVHQAFGKAATAPTPLSPGNVPTRARL